MSNSKELKPEQIFNLIKKIDNKLNDFSEIIQNFGLDIITKFGKSTHNLKILTEKVEELHSTTIDIKGFRPLLSKIIENQDILETEMDLIKSLIQKANIKLPQTENKNECIERDESITKNKELIIEKIMELIKNLNNINNNQLITIELQLIKQMIFEYTGGHKILYEISQAINKLSNEETLSEEFKDDLKEKLLFWKNKIVA